MKINSALRLTATEIEFKIVKQSAVDWQVTKNGESYAWITNNNGSRKFTVTFKHLGGEYPGFRTLTDAKNFATK